MKHHGNDNPDYRFTRKSKGKRQPDFPLLVKQRQNRIDYPRPPVKGGRISITTVLGRICITLSFLAFIGSAGRVDTDPHISIATLGLMLVFSASLAGIGAMLINWRKFS